MRTHPRSGNSRQLLAIDCATLPASVALVGTDVVARQHTHADGRRADAWVGEAVDCCLTESGLTLDDIDGFAACIGPGAFTGIRVGIATALGLAAPRALPVCGVLSLDALALIGSEQGADTVVACIDARRDQVYAALYPPLARADHLPLSPVWGPALCSPHEVTRRIDERGGNLMVVGSGAALLPECAARRAIGIPLATAVGRLALGAWPGGSTSPTNWPAPEPLYLRPPDARPPRNPLSEARRAQTFEQS